MYVEVYGSQGYEGRWDVGLAPGETEINEPVRERMLAQLREGNPRYPDHHVEWMDAGTDLVFGFFYDGIRPRGPKAPPAPGETPPPVPKMDPDRPPPIPVAYRERPT
jgi:hypothetical protein